MLQQREERGGAMAWCAVPSSLRRRMVRPDSMPRRPLCQARGHALPNQPHAAQTSSHQFLIVYFNNVFEFVSLVSSTVYRAGLAVHCAKSRGYRDGDEGAARPPIVQEAGPPECVHRSWRGAAQSWLCRYRLGIFPLFTLTLKAGTAFRKLGPILDGWRLWRHAVPGMIRSGRANETLAHFRISIAQDL
jgi:hypothetical protein